MKSSFTRKSVALFMALSLSTPLAFAATPLSASQTSQLASAENMLFGSTKSGTTESRLEAVEVNLFGHKNSGDSAARLARIEQVVGGSRSSYLMPPLAGSFDSGVEVRQAPQVVDEKFSSSSNGSGDKLEQAMLAYTSGRIDEAERGFKDVLREDPNSADANFNLGVIAESKGNKTEALRYYERASSLNPGDSELKSTVSSLRSDLANAERERIAERQQAERDRAEKARTDRLKQTVADASSLYKKGDYRGAASKLEGVAAQAPGDPDVQYALGQAYRGSGDLNKARDAFSRAQAIDPSSSVYRNALAELNSSSAPAPSSSPMSAPAVAFEPAPAAQPVGEITPFSSSVEKNGGLKQSLLGSRLKRAVAGGAVGAAAGALMSAHTSRSIKSGALQGAIMGSLLGYMSGR
ncbi:MAG: tetratricopeptide repeat protein [Candidatus Obscuribacterales bacterium]